MFLLNVFKMDSSIFGIKSKAVAGVVTGLLLQIGCTPRIDSDYTVIKKLPPSRETRVRETKAFNERIGLLDIDVMSDYILCTERNTEFFFSLYDSNLNLVSQFGRHGRGNEEFIAPVFLGEYSTGKELTFDILDRATTRYQTWVTDSSSGKTSLKESFHIRQDNIFEIRALFRENDGSLFGISDESDCRFFTASANLEDTEFHGNVMSFDNVPAHDLSQTCCAVKPDLSRIAIGYYNLPQMDIRTSDGSIVKSVFIGRILRPEDIDFESPDDYFLKLVADDENIYALYLNGDEHNILSFDWSGRLLSRYSIAPASSFCVDTKSKRVITVNHETSDGACSIYDLQDEV